MSRFVISYFDPDYNLSCSLTFTDLETARHRAFALKCQGMENVECRQMDEVYKDIPLEQGAN